MVARRVRCAAATPGLLVLILVVQLATVRGDSSGGSGSDSDNTSIDGVHGVASMDAYDGIGLIIMACALVLSAAGGVGGGVIMVPIMVLLMGFDIKVATPITNLGIFGGGIANAVFNMRKRHPKVDRPLIDPDLVMIMVPAVIGGVIIGTVLTNLLLSYLLSLLIAVMLAISNSRMLVKSVAMFKKESKTIEMGKMI